MNGTYSVWVNDTYAGGTWTELHRLQPISCRTEMKGRGRASFRVLDNSEVNSLYTDTVSPQTGKFICIMKNGPSSSTNPDFSPSDRIWLGVISSGVKEQHYNSSDFSGTIEAEELGYLLYRNPLVNYIDNSNRGGNLENPPPFNPVDSITGEIVGNRTTDNKLEVSDFTLTVDGEYSSGSHLDFFWDRRRVIKYLVDNSDLDVDVDYDSTLSPSNTFLDVDEFTNPQSYASYKGRSLGEALDELLEPLDWYIDPTVSTSTWDIVIVNPLLNATSNLPAADKKTYVIPSNCIDFTLSESEDRWEKVVLEGDRISCFGSLTTWDAGSGRTLYKGWDSSNLTKFGQGSNYGTVQSDPEKAKLYRDIDSVTYQLFTWDPDGTHSDEVYIQRADKNSGSYTPPGEFIDDGSFDKVAFCPKFTFDSTTGGITADYDISTTPISHSTPNKLNIEFTDFIPYQKEDGTFYDPFVFYPIELSNPSDGSKYLGWANPTVGAEGKDNGKLSFERDGIRIEHPYPEVLAWGGGDDQIIFTGSSGDVSYPSADIGEWEDNPSWSSDRNPDLNSTQYPYRSSWHRLIVTLGVKSDQRISASITRSGVTNPKKVKYLKDESLQVWWAAKGTVYDFEYVNNTDIYPSLVFESDDVFVRNDFPVLLDRIKNYSEYLFQEKWEGDLSIPLAGSEGLSGAQMGTVVDTFLDVSQSKTGNTIVASVERMFNPNSSRMIIGFGRPKTPPFSQIKNNIESGGGITTSSTSSTRGTSRGGVNITPSMIETSDPVKKWGAESTRGGGGGTSTLDPSIFVVEGGNTLGYFSGLVGVSFVENEPSISSTDISGGFSLGLPPGLGYGRNLNTGEREYILHTGDYSPFTFDIPFNTVIYAPETRTVTLSDTGSITVRIPVLMG